MMISTKGRYALRIMIDLAQHADEGYISLKSISERQHISLKYLEIIVSMLNKAGMLKSMRGAGGGYMLAGSADSYDVATVLALTEGNTAPVACIEDGECRCENAAGCLTLPMWINLDKIIHEYLSGITIKDLIDKNVK